MNQKSIYVVVASSLLILFCLIYQGTYSYFVATVTDNRESGAGGTSLSTAYLQDLTVVDESDSGLEFWIPGDHADFNFHIENPSSVPICVKLVWTDVENTWVNKSDLVYTLTDESGETLVEGHPFPQNNDEILIESLTVPANRSGDTAPKYTITVTYNNTDLDQKDDMNKTFKAKVSAKLTNCTSGEGDHS